jgi:cysteine-rich repeat protein
MLASCSSCPGFLASDADRCPHCGASQGSGILERVAKAAATGAMMVTLMACYGYSDDVWPVCTVDTDCGSGATCDETGNCIQEENCFNGFDDDLDGFVDVGDPDCATLPFEAVCDDKEDDDDDGAIDCADLDCASSAACLEVCDNGVDDDFDGNTDCLDTDCPPCPATEVECGNLFDDDADGATDCDDDDCVAVCTPPVCGDGLVAPTEECDDSNTLSGDGCSDQCDVEIEIVCATLTPLELGSMDGTTADGTNVLSASCVPEDGFESIFSYTAPSNGKLYLTLDADHDMGVYVLDSCSTEAVVLACANIVLGGQVESTLVDMVSGASVVVVADGAGPGPGGPFSLVSTFVPE